MNAPYSIARFLERLTGFDASLSLNDALIVCGKDVFEYEGSDPFEVRLVLLEKLSECSEQCVALNLADNRIFSQLAHIKNFKKLLLAYNNVDRVQTFVANAQVSLFLEIFFSLGDTISSARLSVAQKPNLQHVLSETELLLKALQSIEGAQYVDQVLIIQLRSIVRVCSEGSLYSGEELRKKIKSVYADFCAEFDRNDKKFERLHEMLFRWMRSILGPSLLLLSVSADATQILQITKQS